MRVQVAVGLDVAGLSEVADPLLHLDGCAGGCCSSTVRCKLRVKRRSWRLCPSCTEIGRAAREEPSTIRWKVVAKLWSCAVCILFSRVQA